MNKVDVDVTMIGPGVTREAFWWGYIYEGSGEALLACGVVEKEWLADGIERDRRGRIVRTKYAKRAGRELAIERTSARRYQVRESYTETERKRFEQRKELAEIERAIASLPKSHEAFRGTVAKLLECVLASYVPGVARNFAHGGYGYSPEALEDIGEAAAELVRCVAEGLTIFSPALRARQIVAMRAKAAKSDEALQSFLGDLVRGAR